MSRNPQHQNRDAKSNSSEEILNKIEDPEGYNLSRRLRQIHDAREEVIKVKRRALDQDMLDSPRGERALIETVVDYIQEILPTLRTAGAGEQFLNETVEYNIERNNQNKQKVKKGNKTVKVDSIKNSSNKGELTIGEILQTRGQVEKQASLGSKKTTDIINYQASMKAWQICNFYFEQLAGPDLTGGLPEDMVNDEL